MKLKRILQERSAMTTAEQVPQHTECVRRKRQERKIHPYIMMMN